MLRVQPAYPRLLTKITCPRSLTKIAGNHAAAVALARLPETIRGYGPVKERSVAAAKAKRGELMAAFERNDVAEVIAA